MKNFLKPFSSTIQWIHHLNPDFHLPSCVSASCPRPSVWYRIRHPHYGTFLEGNFYCRAECLESALAGQISRLRRSAPSPQPANRIPLGLLMFARGKLSYTEVRAALEAQRRAKRGKIGDWIEKLGFASEQEVTAALALQWGCPVASTFDPATIDSHGGIPLPILESFCMFPFNYAASTNTVYIAFGERVDHAALYAIERIIDCRTQAGVAPRKAVLRGLEAMRQLPRPTEVEFGPINDLSEMARIASSYTSRLSPSHVSLTRIGRFIWVRLDLNREVAKRVDSSSQTNAMNLIFRLPAESQHPLAIRRVERVPASVQLR